MKSTALLASFALLASAPAQAEIGPWTVARMGMPYLAGSATGAGVSVVVGERAEIWSSPDGAAWSQRTEAIPGRHLSEVVHAAGRFVAVGYRQGGGLALASEDGQSWVEAAGTPSTLRDVAYGAGLFVAVGSAASALRSPDGSNWTAAPLPAGTRFSAIAYGAGLFVAVGDERRLFTSPDAVDWADRGAAIPPAIEFLSDVAWTGTRFVAVGFDGTMVSPDGIAWTQVDTRDYTSVAASGSLVVAANFNGYATSPTGEVWTPRSFPFVNGVAFGADTVSYGSGRWIVAGVGGLVRTSSDGLVWTNRTLPGSRVTTSVAHGGAVFCATARYAGAAVSPDGASWTNTIGPSTDPVDLLWTGSRFVSVNPSGGSVQFRTSSDCASWTTASWSLPSGTSQAYFFAVAQDASRLVAVGRRITTGGAQEPLTAVSIDGGASWTTVPSGFGTLSGGLEAVTYGAGKWVATGYATASGASPIVATSSDGLVWTAEAPTGLEPNTGVFALEYGAVGFVAAGSGIWTSTDGVSWTRRTPMGDYFFDVAASPGGYVAVGMGFDQRGVVAVSSDGVQWTTTLRPPRQLRSAAFAGTGSLPGRVVAVGDSIELFADVLPALTVEALPTPEAAPFASPTLRLSAASSGTVTAAYQTADGTASAGSDYLPVAGVVTFPPGVTERVVPVTLVVDGLQEGSETFRLSIGPVSGALAQTDHADVTILDTPTISAADSARIEGDAGSAAAGLFVYLSHPATQTVTVAYQVDGGTATPGVDYVAAAGELTFAPGTTGLLVPALVLGDTAIEPDETFTMSLFSQTNASILDATMEAVIQDDDAPPLAPRELTHGMLLREDLAGGPDAYRLAQAPRASYEVVVDAVAGAAVPVVLERLAADNATVLGQGSPVGTGTSLSLRWVNSVVDPVENQHVRVRGACAAACGTGEVYRLRAYETTLRAPRFSNVGGQVTLLVLQNPSGVSVDGIVYFWDANGSPLLSQAFAVAPRQTWVLNTASVAGLAGRSGSVTVAHTAPYGVLAGKAVALEPSTGFGFDTPLAPRSR